MKMHCWLHSFPRATPFSSTCSAPCGQNSSRVWHYWQKNSALSRVWASNQMEERTHFEEERVQLGKRWVVPERQFWRRRRSWHRRTHQQGIGAESPHNSRFAGDTGVSACNDRRLNAKLYKFISRAAFTWCFLAHSYLWPCSLRSASFTTRQNLSMRNIFCMPMFMDNLKRNLVNWNSCWWYRMIFTGTSHAWAKEGLRRGKSARTHFGRRLQLHFHTSNEHWEAPESKI